MKANSKINLSKDYLLEIIKFLPINQQVICLNINKSLRKKILNNNNQCQALKFFMYMFDIIKYKQTNEGYNILESLFKNDFREYFLFVKANLKEGVLSFEEKCHFYCILFIKFLILSSKGDIIINGPLQANKTREFVMKLRCLNTSEQGFKFLLKILNEIEIHNFNLNFNTLDLKDNILIFKNTSVDEIDYFALQLEEVNYYTNYACEKFNFENINILDFSKNQISFTGNLNSLCDSNFLLKNNSLINFLQNCPNLFHLDLSNNFICDYAIESIFDFFKTRINAPNKIYINLDNNRITNIGGESLYNLFNEYVQNSSYIKISLKDNPMNPSYNSFFSLRIEQDLKLLELTNFNIDDEKLKIIFEEIKPHKETLVSIKFDDNMITDYSFSILDEILNFPRLRNLSLQGNCIHESNLTYLRVFLQLKREDKFISINYSMSKWNEHLICRIISQMIKNSCISMIIENNTVPLHNLKLLIFSVLTYCNDLIYLSLKKNKIDDSFLFCIVDFIAEKISNKNNKLNKLDLSDNLITIKGMQKIVEILGPHINKINLRNNSLTIIDNRPETKNLVEQCRAYSNNFKQDFRKKCISTLRGHSSAVNSVISISPEEIATGSNDSTIKIWEKQDKINSYNKGFAYIMEEYECIYTLTGHKGPVLYLLLLSKALFASASDDKTIRIWAGEDNSFNMNYFCVSIIQGHTKYVTSLILLPEEGFASASEDCTIKIWQKSKCENSNYIELYHSNLKKENTQIDDFEYFYRCKATINGHSSSVECLLLLPDASIASGSFNIIKIWTNYKGNLFECTDTLKGHTEFIYALELLSMHEDMIASGSVDCTICVWRKNSKDKFTCVSSFLHHLDSVRCITLMPEGKFISTSNDSTIKIWGPPEGLDSDEPFEYIYTLKDHTRSVLDAKILDHGKIITASKDGTLKIFQ